MKKEGILSSNDFDQLEDDIIYVLHKAVVKNQVLETLVILNRLINNKTDKNIRKRYRLIEKYQS